MKYFEKNIASGAELIYLHDMLMEAVSTVANNLFYHEAEEDADTPHHCKTLARSAYNLIGICEAIIDQVPDEEAESALEECREHFAYNPKDEARKAAEKIVAAMLGRL